MELFTITELRMNKKGRIFAVMVGDESNNVIVQYTDSNKLISIGDKIEVNDFNFVCKSLDETSEDNFSSILKNMNCSIRAHNVISNFLSNNKIRSVAELKEHSYGQILITRNCGRKILEEIKRELTKAGIILK